MSQAELEQEKESADSDHSSYRGVVQIVKFSSPKFTAGVLAREGTGELITFAGRAYLRVGETVTLLGKWGSHPKWGRQFEVSAATYNLDLDADGLANWLALHPDARGIGPVRAKRVVEHFGSDFGKALAERQEEVAKVAAIPVDNVRKLAVSWFHAEAYNAVASTLAKWDLTYFQINRLVEEYGQAVTKILQEDPYVICRAIDGFGFRRVDDIALKFGTPKDHPGRVRAAIVESMRKLLDDGWTCYSLVELIPHVEKFLALDVMEADEIIADGFRDVVKDGRAVVHENGGALYYALPVVSAQEQEVNEFLKRRSLNPHFHVNSVDPLLKEHCSHLDESQQSAVAKCLLNRVAVVTGGAGSGKTTSIKSLVSIYKATNKTVALCAPTGKAARRITEVVGLGMVAMTIHRLLDYHPAAKFRRNKDNPLDVDVVIVDEVSMVGVDLAAALFRALPKKCAVVLVGDHHQLPSVNPGAILRDCMERGLAAVSILRHCHRQAGALKNNSAKVLTGVVAPSEKTDSHPGPWYVKDSLKTPDEVLSCIEKLFTKTVTDWGFNRLRDVQFLTPIKKGPIGVMNINVMLQRIYQDSMGVEVAPVPTGHRPDLYVGDKVIQTKNNYQLGIMNGNQGVVIKLKPLLVEFDDHDIGVKSIPPENAGELQLAYCLTVHKSQGSEYPLVVVVCHKSHVYNHDRNWLYTAVTRARKTCVIIGDDWGIRRAAEIEKTIHRRTLLQLWNSEKG